MNSEIIHRGPDDEGQYYSEGIGLGMRRLSIIDLVTGAQPIYNEDRSLVIVLNGEIYNYKLLQSTLRAKGHLFSTESDTETVIHAYEEFGVECFTMLDGMFALAIYDTRTGHLLLARDRSGEKPIHYSILEDGILFGSELKSLFSTGLISKELDVVAFNQYLQLTYIPSPRTICSGVFKLPAGHFMTITPAGNTKITQYWDAGDAQLAHGLIEEYEECKQALRQALYSTVEQEMISDVPLGAFLSGGIDSSIIVGVMAEISDRPVKTFTIGFRDKSYDESDAANLIARHNRTDHHVHYLEAEEVIGELDHILQSIDEPFGDSSAIPTYFVARQARRAVTVALTGDGSDELFAGYSKYQIARYAQLYTSVPPILRRCFLSFVKHMPDRTHLMRKVKKVIANCEKDRFSQRRDLMCLGHSNETIQKLLRPEYLAPSSLDFISERYNKFEGNQDELFQTLYTDFSVVLEGDMLHKVDRMSMLNSLETRAPFLGHEVLNVAMRIPSRYKLNGKQQKIILRDTFRDLLPSDIMRKPKRGFSIPLGTWLRGPFKQYIEKYLSEDYIEAQGIFHYSYIKTMVEDHMSSRRNLFSELWTILIFQLVYDRYFNPD